MASCCAYVYLTQPGEFGHILNVLAARRSLHSLGSQVPLQVLVPAAEQNSHIAATLTLLKRLSFSHAGVLNTSLIERPLLARGYGDVGQYGTFRKLALFGYAKWERVVFMDSDALPLGRPDALFGSRGIHAATENGEPFELNSGVLAFSRNASVFDTILHAIEALPRARPTAKGAPGREQLTSDQKLLSFLRNDGTLVVHGLSNWFNFRTGDIAIRTTDSLRCQYARVAAMPTIVHYTYPKPWAHPPPTSPEANCTGLVHRAYVRWFDLVRQACVCPRQRQGGKTRLELLDTYVASASDIRQQRQWEKLRQAMLTHAVHSSCDSPAPDTGKMSRNLPSSES
jgi:hypothetical protein